ncbi:MAG: HD domain-containing protein [Lactovum sp.]
MDTFEKIFRDPIHNDIKIEQRVIYDLINTREFQRLRRIKQLGTSSFTFHGAEHNRFSHSLGVYWIAKSITDHFSKNFPEKWDSKENLLTQCAGLLHDLGHGAYSHTFEHLFNTDHESITQNLICSKTTEVNAVLRQVSEDFPEKVASIISHTYPNQQVIQLISSQIDADRMDYLLRDAYYTGAVYGNFDLKRILHSIQPFDQEIVFPINAMHAVEDYIVSRYQMYIQVYFHPASRSMEVLLSLILKRAKFLFSKEKDYFEKNSPYLLPFFEKNFSLEDYLKLDDGVMNTYFQNWIESQDKILSQLSRDYINRKALKSVKFTEETQDKILLLKKIIADEGYDPDFYTEIHKNYDLPYEDSKVKNSSSKLSIKILNKDGSLEEISKLSPLVSSLTGIQYGDSRFYFPKKMFENPDFTNYLTNDKIK